MRATAALPAALLISATLGTADADTPRVADAYKLCALIDERGLARERCQVDGWNASVKIAINGSQAEAQKACSAVAALAVENRISFDPGWTLKIYPISSIDQPLATCPLG